MRFFTLLVVAGFTLAGCSSNTMRDNEKEQSGSNAGSEYHAFAPSVMASTRFSIESQQLLSTNATVPALAWSTQNSQSPDKDINFYVRGLMQDLVANLQFVNTSTPVAVASFVLLDSDYSETNLLGDQIAESLIHEIHKFGIPVIDYKTRDKISVNSHGDFIFSRDSKSLKSDLPIHYVFSGTLVKYQGGYLVNARVVGVASKAVVASAQSEIPANVASALLNSATKPKYKTGRAVAIVKG